MLVDAWAQHPTPRFLRHPMFESLRRWTGALEAPDQIPIELTTGAMEAAGIDRALVWAWWGPGGPLIGNDEVAILIPGADHSFRDHEKSLEEAVYTWLLRRLSP